MQQTATEKVEAAKKVADDAKAEQAKEVAKLQKVQDALMKELMSARKVRTTLEQQRQLALLEESQANQATQTPGQKVSGQILASRVVQQLELRKQSVIKLSHLPRPKFLHESHMCGVLRGQIHLTVLVWFMQHINLQALDGQIGIVLTQRYIRAIPSMFHSMN